MDLPPEIRNSVYEYCLVIAGEIVPYPTIAEKADEMMTPKYEKPAVALLSVSRKVRDEAHPHLYGNNVWRMSYQARPRLPTTVWDTNLPYFRHVTINFDSRDVTLEYVREHFQELRLGHRLDDHLDTFSLRQSIEIRLLWRVCEEKFKKLQSIMAFQNLVTISLDFGHTMRQGSIERAEIMKKIRQTEAFREIKRLAVNPERWLSPGRWHMQNPSAARKSGTVTCWFRGVTMKERQELFFVE
ncbi:MAG: hypothetical protein Q9200_007368 [Gallowayella weberi]